MKKIFMVLLCFLFFVVANIFVGCKNPNKHPGNEGNQIVTLKIDYMKDLQADIAGNKALGIKKDKINTRRNNVNCASKNVFGIKNLALESTQNEQDDVREEKIERYYLYSTTQTYQNGNVEYDSSSIKKMSFKKNISVTEDVYDENGNLIDSSTSITQEEINAQVNKLYVTDKYSFIQFVALVDESGYYQYYDENGEVKQAYVELRPNSLTFDENGISSFDKENYYSSALSQSFIINNENGYIYKIENLRIKKIHDVDIVIGQDNNIYKIYFTDDNNLVFRDILPNKTISISKVATDSNGWTLVANDSITLTDVENKIIYRKIGYPNHNYLIGEDMKIYRLNANTSSIDKIVLEGNEVDIDNNSIIKCYLRKGDLQIFNNEYYRNHLSNPFYGLYKGYAFSYGCVSVYYGDPQFPGGLSGQEFVKDSIYFPEYNYWNDMYGNINIEVSAFMIEDGVFLVETQGKLYYKKINIDDYLGTNTIFKVEDCILLSDSIVEPYNDDYYISVGNDRIKILNVYRKQSVSQTLYYQVVDNGETLELKLLEDKQYNENTFIFQPINR